MPAVVTVDPPGIVTGPVIGHRGAAGLAPENTMSGFVVARRLGCAWVEIDAKLTRDGVVILMHDDRLDRTTDGAGPVAQADFSAVRTLDAGGWFSPQTKGERVPTLIEALDFAVDLGLGVNVEIKPCPGREEETALDVIDVLAGLPNANVLISSFDAGAIAIAAARCPDRPRALLVDAKTFEGADERAVAMGCEGLHVPHSIMDGGRVNAIRARGLSVRCYTVNDPARAADLIGWGVEAVFSDYPDRLGKLIRG